jgi:hypothetical protein
MIKAKLHNGINGKVYFVLGITDENIAKLRSGDPHMLDMSAFGFKPGEPHNIMLIWGESYDDIAKQISKMKPLDVGIELPPADPKVGKTN